MVVVYQRSREDFIRQIEFVRDFSSINGGQRPTNWWKLPRGGMNSVGKNFNDTLRKPFVPSFWSLFLMACCILLQLLDVFETRKPGYDTDESDIFDFMRDEIFKALENDPEVIPLENFRAILEEAKNSIPHLTQKDEADNVSLQIYIISSAIYWCWNFSYAVEMLSIHIEFPPFPFTGTAEIGPLLMD
jgi:hypothetical protein